MYIAMIATQINWSLVSFAFILYMLAYGLRGPAKIKVLAEHLILS